ncbi:MAG: putative nuclease of RNase H fold RuvC/YqgF family [Candidatus Methanohalarchaeum thermophilum]|uniref:Nuclease of RNase H fold RuvC/YqgF family n=1 Tax=Methanohalarchaeum thermophilum TaxID=1903181 RepID=A0A1Q6DWN8_METT1|nr:MAG: putative nuclease of RNase H fold RuvC/YqgF family [Candidatus Methanohalarchaeum thermophilum]
MGKTDSIKQRRVDVYLDSLERKKKWKKIAENQDDSLSKFIQKAVQYAIDHGGPNFKELGNKAKQIQELQNQINELKEEVKQKDMVIDKLEEEIEQYRTQKFTNQTFSGKRKHKKQLIDLLKNHKKLNGDEILQKLNIDPTNTEVVEGINKQLQNLEQYGLIEDTGNGWRWTQ